MFHKTLFLFLVLCLLALIPASLAQDFDNPSCSIETFTMSPSYGAVPQGTHIDLHGRGNCDGGVRAVRFEVHGIAKAEIGSNEQWETFKTDEFSLGTGLVCFAVAGGNNTSWLAAERRCYTVTIEAADSSSGGQTGSTGGQTGSPSTQDSTNSFNGDLDWSGWCISMGFYGSATDSDGNMYCYNENGSYGRSVDMNAVCVYSSGGAYPYASQADASNPFSWYCTGNSQGSPSGGNLENSPQSQPTPAPATSGGSYSDTCSRYAPLSAGDRGQVTAGLANRVRTGPGTGYQYLTSIPEYTQFDVLSGPYEANELCWYEIQLDNGTVGYTAAGTSSDPWLEWIGEASNDGDYDLNPELPEISNLEPPYDMATAAATLQGVLDLPYDEILQNLNWALERYSSCGVVLVRAGQAIYFIAGGAVTAYQTGNTEVLRTAANYISTRILVDFSDEVVQCAGHVTEDLIGYVEGHLKS